LEVEEPMVTVRYWVELVLLCLYFLLTSCVVMLKDANSIAFVTDSRPMVRNEFQIVTVCSGGFLMMLEYAVLLQVFGS